jgi:hypothetical protein
MSTYQATRVGGVGVNPNDSQQLQVNTETGALLVDVGNGTFTVPGTMVLEGTVDTAPATSIKSTAVLTPADTSKPVTGAGGLGLTVVSTVAKIILWASGAGVTMNYNAAATSSTVQVPITPTEMDCNAADLALVQLLGNASLTVNLIQLG